MFIGPIVCNALSIGIGLSLVFFGKKHLLRYLKISNLATSKVRSLAAGEVEIKGIAVPYQGEPLVSPLQKIRCVSYNLKVYIEVQGRKSRSWSLIEDTTESRKFYVKDDTGYVLVDPTGALVRNDSYK